MNKLYQNLLAWFCLASSLFFFSCEKNSLYSVDLKEWKDQSIVSNYFSTFYPKGAEIEFESLEDGVTLLCGFSQQRESYPEQFSEIGKVPDSAGVYYLYLKQISTVESFLVREIVVTDDFSQQEFENILGKKLNLSRLIEFSDKRITQWGYRVVEYSPGEGVTNEVYKDEKKALGAANGDANNVLSLGNGGFVTIEFEFEVEDLPGPDICIFENGLVQFVDGRELVFAELAYVEVSSDGVNFARFPSSVLDSEAKEAFDYIYPGNYNNLAGISKSGWGVLFDFADLICTREVAENLVNLDKIKFVRVVDIPGISEPASDSACFDSFDQIITDPYKTEQTAGFDLNSLGALNARQ
ncbi:MAG: hypothetical protein JXR63_00715 [Spirochaetales bacterium]|nr:hypothetical protein [Spirochaetales bacterium]